MKSKELIKRIQQADPSGEIEVCVGNVDIFFVDVEPAYYDGVLQVLDRDENNPNYNIIGAKYKRTGSKVVINTLSIVDAICDNPELPIDYSELDEARQEQYKESHNKLRIWHKNLENKIEKEYFIAWVTGKASELTADTEDARNIAVKFFEDNNLSANNPLPDGGIQKGESYVSTRIQQWDAKFKITIDDGFIKLENK